MPPQDRRTLYPVTPAFAIRRVYAGDHRVVAHPHDAEKRHDQEDREQPPVVLQVVQAAQDLPQREGGVRM